MDMDLAFWICRIMNDIGPSGIFHRGIIHVCI